jgi:hypothetical protein
MRLRIRGNSGMEVKFENECFTISLGEDLIETREQFLEHMGQMFDEAVYSGLRSNAMMIDEHGYIPKTVIMQRMEKGKESYDTLKEIQNYIQNTGYGVSLV